MVNKDGRFPVTTASASLQWPHSSASVSPLFTDLYELTMAQAYQAEHMDETAVFELAFRTMPRNRNYVVAAGFGDVVQFLAGLQFRPDDLEYLRKRKEFTEEFLRRLESLRFTGDVYAVPEGTIVFPNEPMLQVIAPVTEAQLIETYVLNQVHLQSVAASKAARVVDAAGGRAVVDFGSRRAHGTDAALKVARAVYLGGAAGTSNVLAGKMYGIPVFGTMAHSYIQAHADEAAAFEAFASLYPETTLLVDTYDTLAGVRKVIDLSRKPTAQFRVRAVRLDSGDLGRLAAETRKLLDDAGLENVGIFASSGLDEYEVRRLVQSGAPINAFGVGTKMVVSADAPELDMAYKLVEYGGTGRLKLSTNKLLYPGRKQVFRQVEEGIPARDVIGRFDERLPGEPLLRPLMKEGGAVARVDLSESRSRLQRELQRLPPQVRGLDPAPAPYPVHYSERLQAELDAIREKLRGGA
ncbi:MAG: nicotinate phosphoribosyltransferase [Bryobacterales bacterium]|nr:nicotinate phosphoribosyltransferase [Bryobacterales bacterium]